MPLPTGAEVLLRGLVDYAGLFPPAQEPMDVAVRQYAAYRRGPQAWMLGRFICPAARLDEFADTVAPYLPDGVGEWRLSVLLGPEPAADVARIAALNAAHVGVLCDATEGRAADAAGIARLARLTRDAALPCYVELPVDEDPSALIAAVGAAGLRAKIRTGGVTAEAFPTAAQVARFLGACVRADVPFKATAGLHHPLRGEYRLTYEAASAHGTMFGFLNVLLATAWLRDGATDADAVALLEERDAAAFTFSDRGVQWRDVVFLHARLERLRTRVFTAVGSCSFTEPVHELAFVPGWTAQ
jgi:hypothetical protein